VAVLSITVDELYERAKEFDLIPEKIKDVTANGRGIIAKVDAGFGLPPVTVELCFEFYSFGKAYFKIEKPVFAGILLKLFKKPVGIYKDVVTVENQKLVIDLNKAIEIKTDKIKVKNVNYFEKNFTITI
jgi:hypothetical protein